MHIPVIFEDGDILVINKPSGIVVHPFDFSDEETVLDFLREYFPAMFSIENSVTLQDGRMIPLGGIMHKLDRETSGVMAVAKNQKTFDELRAQFAQQEIEKTYVALVEGVVEEGMFRIDAPLGRSKKDYKQSTAPENPRGELREAITDVEVIERKNNTTLVKLTPLTGRTHQLRAHMASIGHPIVGDISYGYQKKQETGSGKREKKRIMLHAQSMSFTINGEKKKFEAEVPEEFERSALY
jgi:23S rRNA pseudouridine1911/1915/1917 synthase